MKRFLIGTKRRKSSVSGSHKNHPNPLDPLDHQTHNNDIEMTSTECSQRPAIDEPSICKSTTDTSSYTFPCNTDQSSCIGRVLKLSDAHILREFMGKINNVYNTNSTDSTNSTNSTNSNSSIGSVDNRIQEFSDKSFEDTLISDQSRNIINIIFTTAWFIVALVSVAIDKRPWHRYSQARIIEFKILSNYRNLKVIQLIVQTICQTAKQHRCSQIIVHASPDDFKLFESANWSTAG